MAARGRVSRPTMESHTTIDYLSAGVVNLAATCMLLMHARLLLHIIDENSDGWYFEQLHASSLLNRHM